jgi:hypothetical protein
MAVRGLGGPVRFVLTGGQGGDCPQAHRLIEGLPTDVFIADAAHDTYPSAESFNYPHRRFEPISMPRAIS